MKTTQQRLEESKVGGFLRKRDLSLVILSCVVALYSFQGGNYDIDENWFQPIDNSVYRNQHFPEEDERLPQPLITDLDGDGTNEIVFVTTDYEIKIAKIMPSMETIEQLPIQAENSLLTNLRITTGRWPIALASGYLTPFQEGEIREQVIVVITNGWTVLCFSASLRLLWESNVEIFVPPDMFHSEIAAIVTSKSIRNGDKGSVIVGGRLSRIQKENDLGHDHDSSSGGNLDDEEDMLDHASHFAYFAFDGRTGAVRWKHGEEEMLESDHDVHDEDEYMPEHSYKLHVFRARRHFGEVDWRQFQESVLAQLPHIWRTKDDTKFQLAHFQKRTQLGGKQVEGTWSTEDLGIHSSHVPGLAFGGSTAHHPSEHIEKPNVVVAHIKDGIEIVHLYTGKTVCRLSLNVGTTADINNDGIVEELKTVCKEMQNPLRRGQQTNRGTCNALVTTGIPVVEELFNRSISSGGMSLGAFDLLVGSNSNSKSTEAAVPIVLGSHRSSTFTSQHSEREMDSIFLISSGRLTSLRPTGKYNWQIDTGASWDQFLDEDFEAPFTPFLTSFPLEPFGVEDYILAVGQSLVVVSGTGSIVSSIPLPEASLSAPIIGDFNNDGMNDVIVVGSKGLYGFSLRGRLGYSLLPIPALLLVIVSVLFVKSYQGSLPKKRAMD